VTGFLIRISTTAIVLVGLVLVAVLLSPPKVKSQPRPELVRPQWEWVYWADKKGAMVIGLHQDDFIKITQYIRGLEHEYSKCSGEVY